METRTATADPGGTSTSTAEAAPLILAEGLRKAYGPVRAVDDLSFAVPRGEILGLLGPNGAGKSTALRMLVGFQYPDAGRVLLDGKDVFLDGPAARASLGYLPEAVPLYAEMEVGACLSFFAGLKGVPDRRAAVRRAVERLDLGGVLGRPCGNLSRGYRQRVGLAQALLHDPSVLILDEPTGGLDPNQIHDFRGLLREVGSDRAVLLSTHILPEALEVCDRVLILNRGRVVASGRPAELMGEAGRLAWARLVPAEPPDAETAERFGLAPEDPAAGGRSGVWRIHGELRRSEARDLLRICVERDWEILEWGAGAAGLEAVFRSLTVGEEGR